MSLKIDSRGNQYTCSSLYMKLEEDLGTLSSVLVFFWISVIMSNRWHFYFNFEKKSDSHECFSSPNEDNYGLYEFLIHINLLLVSWCSLVSTLCTLFTSPRAEVTFSHSLHSSSPTSSDLFRTLKPLKCLCLGWSRTHISCL